jgi:primosomal protein N' (replication factor Y)
VTHADRELSERNELRFPPAIRLASLTGPEDAVREVLDAAELPRGADVLGPVPVADSGRRGRAGPGDGKSGQGSGEDGVARMLVRVDRRDGTALAAALRAAQATRTARKDAGVVRLQLDPAELL